MSETAPGARKVRAIFTGNLELTVSSVLHG